MVVRLAHFWRKMPHEIWSLPFTYYVALRNDWLDIVSPAKEEEVEGDLSLERMDQLSEKGIVDIDYDALMRKKQSRKAGRRGK